MIFLLPKLVSNDPGNLYPWPSFTLYVKASFNRDYYAIHIILIDFPEHWN